MLESRLSSTRFSSKAPSRYLQRHDGSFRCDLWVVQQAQSRYGRGRHLKHNHPIEVSMCRDGAVEVIGAIVLIAEGIAARTHQLEVGGQVHNRFRAGIAHGEKQADQGGIGAGRLLSGGAYND